MVTKGCKQSRDSMKEPTRLAAEGGESKKQPVVKAGTHLQREKDGAGSDGKGEDVGNRTDNDV